MSAFATEYGGSLQDLATLFEAGDSGIVTGFVDTDGADLGSKFAPLAQGSPIPFMTGYVTAAGLDLAELFAAAGTVGGVPYWTGVAGAVTTWVGVYAGVAGTISPPGYLGIAGVNILADYTTAPTGFLFELQSYDITWRDLFAALVVNGVRYEAAAASFLPGYDDGEGGGNFARWTWASRPVGFVNGQPYEVVTERPEFLFTGTVQAGNSGANTGFIRSQYGSYTRGSGFDLYSLVYYVTVNPSVSQVIPYPTTSVVGPVAVQANGGSWFNFFSQAGANTGLVAPGNPLGLSSGVSYAVASRPSQRAAYVELTIGSASDGEGYSFAGFALPGYAGTEGPAFGSLWGEYNGGLIRGLWEESGGSSPMLFCVVDPAAFPGVTSIVIRSPINNLFVTLNGSNGWFSAPATYGLQSRIGQIWTFCVGALVDG